LDYKKYPKEIFIDDTQKEVETTFNTVFGEGAKYYNNDGETIHLRDIDNNNNNVDKGLDTIPNVPKLSYRDADGDIIPCPADMENFEIKKDRGDYVFFIDDIQDGDGHIISETKDTMITLPSGEVYWTSPKKAVAGSNDFHFVLQKEIVLEVDDVAKVVTKDSESIELMEKLELRK